MALQGNLDDFSLPEILQLIAVQQKSGVLKLTAGDDVAVIFFEGGKIVSTRDRRRNAKDPLKPFLVKIGRLTDAQLKQIETIEAESRRELTDILLSGNYLSSEELTHVLEQQIQDTLHQLLTWKTGSYHFSGDARTVPKFAVNVRLNTEGLLMESMRRIDESSRYKETFTSLAMVLRPKPLATPAQGDDPAGAACPAARRRAPSPSRRALAVEARRVRSARGAPPPPRAGGGRGLSDRGPREGDPDRA
jgi:hypothetical protein